MLLPRFIPEMETNCNDKEDSGNYLETTDNVHDLQSLSIGLAHFDTLIILLSLFEPVLDAGHASCFMRLIGSQKPWRTCVCVLLSHCCVSYQVPPACIV